jgi:hypothetical protein
MHKLLNELIKLLNSTGQGMGASQLLETKQGMGAKLNRAWVHPNYWNDNLK